MSTILLVAGILVFLIVVHELGHFLMAKLFRVRVEEFGIGYPPRAFTLGKFGGTEYTLNWIPFGGFVRLWGDIGESQRGKGSLVDASRFAQAAILIAGVAMNALAAWALFAAALHVGIPRAVNAPREGEVVRLVVANVVPGSPADAAGIAAGDEILGLNDVRSTLSDLNPEAFSNFVRERAGREMTLTYARSGETRSTSVVPAHAVVPEAAGRPALGVGIVLVSTRPLPWSEAFMEAFAVTGNAFTIVTNGFSDIARRALAGVPALSDVVGPLGLVGVVSNAAESGLGSVLSLAAFISVNLVIINLLPIPVLDGGRLALLAVEALVRRSAPRVALQLLNALGISLVIAVMAAVTYNDIVRLLA